MSIFNPLSSSYNPKPFLDYKLFHVTSSIPVSSSQRTPTSSAQLRSGSVFLLSASAEFTAGLAIQTKTELVSYVAKYNPRTAANDSIADISGSVYNDDDKNYDLGGFNTNVVTRIEGPITITTGSEASNTTGSIRIGYGRVLRIIDGENFTVNLGCTDPTAINYNPGANLNDGSCILPIYGCINPNSANYNPFANIDDGSCAVAGCTDPTAINYNPLATTENGTCQYVTDGTYINTNSTTTHTDNSDLNNPTVQNLTTAGSILMRTSGEAYVGPYHTTTYNTSGTTLRQIYVAGISASSRPNTFVDGDILVLRNGNRRYTDNNNPISNNLPTAYNQPVSQEQNCSNCIFYDSNKNLNCTRWEAKVRTNYWCAKYKPSDVLTPAGDTFRSDYPGIIQTGLTTGGNEFLLTNRSFYVGSYRIMPDGVYFADDTLPFRILTLKQTLKFGPNRHFTKVNKNLITQNISPSSNINTTTTTTVTPSSTPTVSTSGTGTSYSY